MINIAEFFNESNTKHGLVVRTMSSQDNNIVDKFEKRTDLIQISFANLAIVWDLNENKEVAFVENQT